MNGKEALKAMIDGEVVKDDNGQFLYRLIESGLETVRPESLHEDNWLEDTSDIPWVLSRTFTIYKEPEHRFKPFEQVLVRDEDQFEWEINIYGRKNDSHGNEHICLRRMYTQCIPFKGNEHLLGTTEQP